MSSWWNVRYIRRRQEIVGTFMKHGLGYLLQRFGLASAVQLSPRQLINGEDGKARRLLADNLCRAMVELGPTFIKLGQMLSTRPDMLPPPYIEALESLQDKVEPLPYEQILKQMINEMGDPEEIFAEFDINPLAAASIGQVHRARLKSGEEVIVKIQRPGIESKVESDLEIIKGLARMSERRSSEARRIGIYDMVEEYGRMLLRELDYAREARNTDRVYNNFRDDERVVIPRVYWQYTTPRVLTQEYLAGFKLSDIGEIDRQGWDRRKISQLGTEAFLSQILLHGFFQADPHPGNILVVDENTIAFIDFGEIGTLTERRLLYLGELLVSLNKGDIYKAMGTLRDIGIAGDSTDNEDFYEDFVDLVKDVSSTNIGSLDMKRLRKEAMELAYRYHLQMPSYLTALMKALITVEGVGKKLDPDFNFTEVARPLALKVYKERLKPDSVYKFFRSKYYQDVRPLGKMPSYLNALLSAAKEGNLTITMKVEFTPKTDRKLTQLASRVSASLIITGALIGSALIIQTNHSAQVEKYAYLGVIGFGMALICLIVYFLASLRS
ncbi:ABC1 kinase family protein [Syntrophomonas curvata]